jgi:glycogen debranching enzyme
VSQPWTTNASTTLGGDGGLVTLVEGTAFAISLSSGDIVPGFPHGLFFRDTRFLSELRLRVNDQWPEQLGARGIDPFSAEFVVRDPPAVGKADSHLVVFRKRYVGRGLREDVVVRNYGLEPAYCSLEFMVAADFANLFQVKAGQIETGGDLSTHVDESRVTWSFRRGRLSRGARLEFSKPPKELSPLHAVFEVLIPADERWEVCLQLTPIIENEEIKLRYPCNEEVQRALPSQRLEQWRSHMAEISSNQRGFDDLVKRSTEDMAALRLFDPEHRERTVVAAGAPWFMALFGRDSLLTSYMTLLVDTDLALGTLQTLAHYQGRDVNPITEEEPGRILHEMRFGDSAALSLGGGQIYYGSVDATPLFVMLLGELRRWGNRPEEVDALLPAADRALEWIEKYGDRDKDGYVEYRRTSDKGLSNQGWKDSYDGVSFANGALAEAPIALCEVQGYVYAAYIARGHFATELGDTKYAKELYDRAAALKSRFNREFWLEEHGWLAMGLDRDKRPIDALTSNMGHCLWTGILDTDKAEIVGKRLLSDELFSGWGVRTLATSMARYNPVSYHNGSVWPHDNAICVAGLMRYGLVDAAHRVIEGIIDAAAYFGNRLPELFAGLPRDEVPFPVHYPTSCSPQAWAAASPLLMLRAMLRFDPDIRRGHLYLSPEVPERIAPLVIEGVPLKGKRLTIRVEEDKCEVEGADEEFEVLPQPRPPTL